MIDGPFAETEEQLLGFHVIDCASLEEAIETAHVFLGEAGALEIRPIAAFDQGAGVRYRESPHLLTGRCQEAVGSLGSSRNHGPDGA